MNHSEEVKNNYHELVEKVVAECHDSKKDAIITGFNLAHLSHMAGTTVGYISEKDKVVIQNLVNKLIRDQ